MKPRPPKTLPKKSESDDEEVNQDASTKVGPREPFLNYDDAEILTFLDRAVKEDRVQLFIQPTVRLPQRIPAFMSAFPELRIMKEILSGPSSIFLYQMLPVSQQLWTIFYYSDVFSSFARHDESSLTFYSSVIFQIRHLQILSFSLTL